MKAKKQLLSTALLTFSLNVLVKPTWLFLFDRRIQLELGLEQYGRYAQAWNFAFILSLVLDFGLTNWNNRQLAASEKDQLSKYSLVLGLKLFLSGFYFLLCGVLGYLYGFHDSGFHLLMSLSIMHFLSNWLMFFRGKLSGTQRFSADSILTVLDRVVAMIGCAMLLWWTPFKPYLTPLGFVHVQTLAYLISVMIALMMLGKNVQLVKPVFSGKAWMSILKQAFPYFGVLITMGLYSRMDMILLKNLTPYGDHSAGIYASIYRLFEAASIFPMLAGGILTPLFARQLSEGNDVRPIIKQAASLLFIPAIALVVFSFVFGIEVIDLLYSSDGLNCVQLGNRYSAFGIQMLAFACSCLMYIYGTLLTAKGEIRWLIRISIAGVLVNGLSNWLLIPSMDFLGASYSAVLTQVFIGLSAFAVVGYQLKLKVDWVQIIRWVLFGFSLVLVGSFIQQKVSIDNNFSNFLLELCIFGASTLVFAILFGLLKLKEGIQLLINKH